ncbi:hypothetical protein [Modestobacter sp. I12A-02662]|uniref:hypothetical protein n=1 Tax=Modestobacter sp. I12A-02662 TaxID=1730496 RepID=UPI0034DE4FCF
MADGQGRPPGAGAGRPVSPGGPPPRPPVRSPLAPPAPHRPRRAPASLRAAAWCWAGAVLIGLAGLVTAAVDLAGTRQRVTGTARAADPSAPDALLRDGADTTIALVLGSTAALTVLVAVALVPALRRRRPGRRWLLIGLGALLAVADAFSQAVVAGGPEVDRWAFLVQGVLALAGTGLLLAPSAAVAGGRRH